MKRFVFVTFALLTLASCKEKTTYQSRIMISNETDSTFTVKLFPQSKYMHGMLYDFSAIGGGYRDVEFDLDATDEIELYISDDLDIGPTVLAAQVFDSIHIVNRSVIRFSPAEVTGYPVNLYQNDSLWNFFVREFDLPTNFKNNHVESYDYVFTISGTQ